MYLLLNLWLQLMAESAPQPERRCCRLRRWGTSWAWCTAAACTTTAASSPSGSAYPPSPASGRRGAAQLTLLYSFFTLHARQMKGQWESNINVWFPFKYSQKWNCAASLFPKQNYNGLSPNFLHSHICERFIYFQDGCGPILGIYKSLTNIWM